jgi:hypothetical protein
MGPHETEINVSNYLASRSFALLDIAISPDIHSNMSSQENKLLFVALVVTMLGTIAIIVTFNSIISDKPTSKI